MILLLKAILLAMLIVIAFYDFKYREFPWWAIPGIVLPLIVLGLLKSEPGMYITQVVLNLLFVFVQLLILFGWFFLKERKFVNLLDHYLGLGDILFFLSICFAFSFFDFVIYHSISLMLAFIAGFLYLFIVSPEDKRIPVAGILAIIFFIVQLLVNTHEANSLLRLTGICF